MAKKKRRKFEDLEAEEQIERLIVGRAVAILRAARGLNKKQLALRMKVSPSTVLAFERGERDPEDKNRLDQYMRRLGVEASDYRVARELAQDINGWKPYEPPGKQRPVSELREADPAWSGTPLSLQRKRAELLRHQAKVEQLKLDLEVALLEHLVEKKLGQLS